MRMEIVTPHSIISLGIGAKNLFLTNILTKCEDGSFDTLQIVQNNTVDKIKNLAGLIKSNGWIEAIIYGIEEDGVPYIIEGQHRTRAMKLLGFNTVPGIGIKFY